MNTRKEYYRYVTPMVQGSSTMDPYSTAKIAARRALNNNMLPSYITPTQEHFNDHVLSEMSKRSKTNEPREQNEFTIRKKNEETISVPFENKSGHISFGVEFQSRYRDYGSLTSGSYGFYINKKESNSKTTTPQPLIGIVAVKVYPFMMPNAFSTEVFSANYFQHHLKTFRLSVSEVGGSGIQIPNGKNYLFNLRATPDGFYIHANADINNTFVFSRPVSLNTITLEFTHNNIPLQFAPDQFDNVTITYVNPGRFTTTTQHGLLTNSCVQFPDINISPVINPTLQSNGGFLVTVVDPYTFTIPVDLTPYGPLPTTTSFIVTERQINIMLEFICLSEEPTNFLRYVAN